MSDPQSLVYQLASATIIPSFANLDRALIVVLVAFIVSLGQGEVSYLLTYGPDDSGQNTFGLGISEHVLVGSLLTNLKLVRWPMLILIIVRDRVHATHSETNLSITSAVRYGSIVALKDEILNGLF